MIFSCAHERDNPAVVESPADVLDQALIEKMLTWDVHKAVQPNFPFSKEERKFISTFQTILKDKKFFACYGIESSTYFLNMSYPFIIFSRRRFAA